MPGKIHGNKSLVSQKSCAKNPASRNNSISKASQMVKANLSSVVLGHSISLHNRFDMFHNTALFPENGCKSVTCDQKVVCLHSKKREEQDNIHKSAKNTSKAVSNDTSVNQNTETEKLTQQTTHQLYGVDKNSVQSYRGESDFNFKNNQEVSRRRSRSVVDDGGQI